MSKRGTILNSQTREIILEVDKYFEQERNECSIVLKRMSILAKSSASEIMLPRDVFDDVLGFLKKTNKLTDRVAAATGISKNTVCRIRGEGNFAMATSTKITAPQKGKRGPKVILNNSELTALRNMIISYEEEHKRVPSIDNILATIKKDFSFIGGKTTLRRILKKEFGYTFKLNSLMANDNEVNTITTADNRIDVYLEERISDSNSDSDSNSTECMSDDEEKPIIKFDCHSPESAVEKTNDDFL